MSIVAVVPARMGSTRLPGKVLLPLAGRPLLDHVLDRVARVPSVRSIVVAISEAAEDEPIARMVQSRRVKNLGVFRGFGGDVVARCHAVAQAHDASLVWVAEANAPLLEPESAERCIRALTQNEHLDAATNASGPGDSSGLAVSVLRRGALEKVNREAKAPEEREKVMAYIWAHRERFFFEARSGTRLGEEVRWVVETPADYELMRRIYDALGTTAAEFGSSDVMKLMKRFPHWAELNRPQRGG